MKASVDQDLCIGCGICLDTCPEVFKMEGEIAVVCIDPVPSEVEESVRDAIDQCPVEAITIEWFIWNLFYLLGTYNAHL